MLMLRAKRAAALALLALAWTVFCSSQSRAQAALLLEEPYGVFGALNPTGHTAIYFQRICAETPVKLRRCSAGETGVVIARYQGISNYDWVAIPLFPYLYSVEESSQVPRQANRKLVASLRTGYYQAHRTGLGGNVQSGDFFHGGWDQILGVAYDRRIFAYRFATSREQDDAIIATLNNGENRSHFDLLFNNCADFARGILNRYFPGTFNRSFFPDAGITTPKQITSKLVRYARKHPEVSLNVFEIPQVPGYRRMSRANKGIAESLSTTGYAVPIALLNPYLAGGIFLDYLIRGRFHLQRNQPEVLTPDRLLVFAGARPGPENPRSTAESAAGETGPPVNRTVQATEPDPAQSEAKP